MKCQYFEQRLCRSCELLDKTYADTLAYKENQLKTLIKNCETILKPTVALNRSAENSRGKAKLAVFLSDSKVQFGFFNSQGVPQPLESCPLHFSGINELLPTLRLLLKKYEIVPYDLTSRTGEIKYLLISKSHSSGDLLLRFVLRSKTRLEQLRRLSAELCAEHPSVRVTTANIQPIAQAVLEGDEELVLTEQSSIQHQFDEFSLTMGPRSFFQVTPLISRELYLALGQVVERERPASFLDLYCGVGAFSFYASRFATQVIGVEISKEAIRCAKHTAAFHQIKNVRFTALDVQEYLQTTVDHFEAVLVNPPRRGLNEKIIQSILRLQPKWIYYSSCNAETLARDALALSGHYGTESLQIFDMFPFTKHYETFMVLGRK